jgi:hypothetical protein
MNKKTQKSFIKKTRAQVNIFVKKKVDKRPSNKHVNKTPNRK